jgi:predicted ATPase/DNA-binding SARP family transcriptional activator
VPTALTLSLLPEPAILHDGRRIPLRGEIPTAIAARLALTPGVSVTAETLVDELWTDPPETATVSVRVGVSKLRATELGDLVEGGRGGYRLNLAPDDIDLTRALQVLAGNTDAEGRRGLLESVEPLWDEAPLSSLADRPFAIEVRARFAALRRDAIVELAELRLADGDTEDSGRGLEPLLREQPLDEQVVELRARALARGGRVREALELIDELRGRLADALGLDLPASLEELRQAIVRQSPDVVGAADFSDRVERHGIPVPITRFIGRERDLEAVEQARAASRLVTVTGPGGVGKTRLVIESTRRATRAVDEEQWMVDLAAVPDGDGVSVAVGELLGTPEPSIATLARRLGGRRTLLVLDNAEHVLDATRELVRGVLAGAEGLSVVVTSREALKMPGERVVALPPMLESALPDAERLFRERAADARPDLDLDLQRSAIRRLCLMLDGMPLALELAAAQLDVLDLDEVAAAVVAGAGAAGLAARHASVTDTIRSSVELLSTDERTLLAQVACFAGTFRIEDVAGVCTVGEGTDVATLARRLVQKSLLAPTDHNRVGRRFRVLESVKAYSRATLPLDGADSVISYEQWRARHRAWFATVVDELALELRGHDAAVGRALLDLAAPDLQLALADAVSAGDRAAALRIAGGQAHYWMGRGLLADGLDSLERALATPGDAPVALESVAVTGMALLTYQSGNQERALHYMALGLEVAERAGDASRVALLSAYGAYAASLFGDPEQVEPLLAIALGLLDDAEPWAIAEVLMCQGQAMRALGRPAQALEHLEEARALATQIGYAWIAGSARYVAGKVLIDVRRAREAVELLVPAARRLYLDEDAMSSLAFMHLVAGACALLERHRLGATIFGAVDKLGERFGYSPVRVEGQDAQVHRDRVAQGLTAEEWDAAYREGARLDFDGLFALGASLLPASIRLAA